MSAASIERVAALEKQVRQQSHSIMRLKRQTETLNLTLEAALERLSEVEKEVGGVLEARACESDSSPDSEEVRTEDAEKSAGDTSSSSASSLTSSSDSSAGSLDEPALTPHQPDAYDPSLSSSSEEQDAKAPVSLQPLRYSDIVKSKQALLAKKPVSSGKAAAEKKPLKSAGAAAPIKKRKVKE